MENDDKKQDDIENSDHKKADERVKLDEEASDNAAEGIAEDDLEENKEQEEAQQERGNLTTELRERAEDLADAGREALSEGTGGNISKFVKEIFGDSEKSAGKEAKKGFDSGDKEDKEDKNMPSAGLGLGGGK